MKQPSKMVLGKLIYIFGLFFSLSRLHFMHYINLSTEFHSHNYNYLLSLTLLYSHVHISHLVTLLPYMCLVSVINLDCQTLAHAPVILAEIKQQRRVLGVLAIIHFVWRIWNLHDPKETPDCIHSVLPLLKI